MMMWIIPAVLIGGLVIGTVIYSITKTTSNNERETTLPERSRNDWESRRQTHTMNLEQSQKEEKSIALEFCPNCGARIHDRNSKYCTSCGDPLT